MSQRENRTVFEWKGNQSRLWKLGHYDYLDSDALEGRYEFCAEKIAEHFNEKVSVLDIAAGSGGVLPFICRNVSEYTYVDISVEASDRFRKILSQIDHWDGAVTIKVGDVSKMKLEGGYQVILGLGLSRYTMPPEFFQALIESGAIDSGGLMILEGTTASGSLDYYGSCLPRHNSEHVFVARGIVAEVVRKRHFRVYTT